MQDARFFELLSRFDEDLAAEVREAGCGCGGVLHSARYPRKPRGGPEALGQGLVMRASLCCAVEGCRRRSTPPSLLFLGRKVFYGVLVLLIPILREGPTPERVHRLEAKFGVSRRTLYRWRRWWWETVPRSRWWQQQRGLFPAVVDGDELPGLLLAALGDIEPIVDRVLAALKLLASLPVGLAEHGR